MKGLFDASAYRTDHKLVFPKAPQCNRCQLYKQCNSPKMSYTGKGKKGILIIAEAPSAKEDRAGKFLFGEATQFLEGELLKLGIHFSRDCWRTNAVWCNPNNKMPSVMNIECCRPNVIHTIEELKPTHILVLGKAAIQSFMGWAWGKVESDSLTKWAGWIIPERKSGAWVLPTWHPAALVRENEPDLQMLRFHFREQLQRFFLSTTEPPPFDRLPSVDSHVHIMMDSDEVIEHVRGMIDVSTKAAFDYETNCLKPELSKAYIRCMSICFDGKSPIAFPMSPKLKPVLIDFFRSPIGKIAANLQFEDRWTRCMFKVDVRKWLWDTMVMTHLLDNRPGITSLKFQSFVQMGVTDYASHVKPYLETTKGPYNRIDEIQLSELLRYNGLDSLFEFHLYEIQRRQQKDRLNAARDE